MMTENEVELAYTIDVAAPASSVWNALVDWSSQGEWMLATDVVAIGPADGVGGTIEAFTGLIPQQRILGFLDTMTITAWEPPHRCDVVHTGKVVRGTGSFVVEEVSATTSRFHWSEQVLVPFGLLGRIAWLVVGPLMGAGVRISLRRLVRRLEHIAA